jgi:sugar transferase (PEP-CTERM/EpsH1 system associated)
MEPLLFLAHRVPVPPNKGDKIRSHHLLKALAKSFRIYLGAFLDDPNDRLHLGSLAEFCAEAKVVELHPRLGRLCSLRGLARDEPLTLPYYRNAELAQWVRSVTRQHGIRKALVYSSGMAQYLALVPEVDSVIDFVDVDSAKWVEYGTRRRWPLSALYAREGRLLLEFERRVAAQALAACFVTAEEAALFRQLAPECAAKTFGVLNGVDGQYFSPAHDFPSPYSAGERALVFTGAMDYWPNIDAVCWFARDVLPLVRAQAPAVRFYIVGMNPSPAVRELAGEGVVVTGRVDDVRPYLRHASVAVAPLRVARGLQNKVLEAMAMGRPVVASAAAAVGIAVRRGEDIQVADLPSDFAEAVLGLLEPVRAEQMGQQARRAVLVNYDWETNLAAFKLLLTGNLPRSPAVRDIGESERASEAA